MQLLVPPHAYKACQILSHNGFQAFLVGGAIRDSLLGLEPSDWDVATDAKPEQVQDLFARSYPTGKEFGTITVLVDDRSLEITTMRRDGPYSDGRHPDYITFSDSIEVDLSRRDFTINAIAYDPVRERLVDPFFGQRHLRRKLLSTVGEPVLRFQEDPLRMLRLVRFQATLGFKIDKKTKQPLNELAWLLQRVSVERTFTEMNKLLLGRELLSALETLYASGLMQEVLPELAAGSQVSAGPSHPHTLLGHSLAAAHFCYPNLSLRWAALLHDLGKLETLNRDHAELGAQMAKAILRRLKAPSTLTAEVTTLIKHHMFAVQPNSSEREIRRFLATVGPETAFELVKLRLADMAGMNGNPKQILQFGQALEGRFKEVLAADNALTLRHLKINGHDLKQFFQLGPGPRIGEILDHLLEHVWNNPLVNERDTLLTLARSYLESVPEKQDAGADPS